MWIVAAGLALAAGCAAQVGTKSPIPKDAAAQCKAQCEATGMTLSALVIVDGQIGCVCNPPAAPATAATQRASAGIVATVLLQNAAADQARRDSTIRSTK